MEVRLRVIKTKVYDEVAKTTSYTGAKMVGDEDAYERIYTTDEDQQMLERFWSEGKILLCEGLKKVLISETESDEGVYEFRLQPSVAFDRALEDSMQRSLFSFFVMHITSKWYALSNKTEAASYATEATVFLEDIKRKAFFKKKPTRPIYDN